MRHQLVSKASICGHVAANLPGIAPGGKVIPIVERSQVSHKPTSEMTEQLISVRDHRDREAFGRLFDHFAPKLKSMLIKGGLNDGSAEDMVQDVMLKVWQKAAQFDPHRAEASSWIYRIARNRQIDLARRRPLPQPEVLEMPANDELDVDQVLSLKQEAEYLRDALSRLSPEQSVAIRQAFVEELPHSQISEVTGVPLGTVKSRIRLGLGRLRHELRDLKT